MPDFRGREREESLQGALCKNALETMEDKLVLHLGQIRRGVSMSCPCDSCKEPTFSSQKHLETFLAQQSMLT